MKAIPSFSTAIVTLLSLALLSLGLGCIFPEGGYRHHHGEEGRYQHGPEFHSFEN